VGDDRPAVVLEPAEWDGASELPLVVALHGYGNSGSQIVRWLGLTDRSEALVLLPDGIEDERGYRFWDATDECCDFYDGGVDDVGYVLDLVAQVRERWPVDPLRIALVGHSNGAFLSYTLACQPTHPFSALVSIAGSSFWDPTQCAATRPVSVLQVHGTRDRAQAIEGDPTGPSAFEVLGRWGQRGGCAPGLAARDRRDYTPVQPGEETARLGLSGCDEGIDVALWRLDGATHSPSFNAAFTEDLVGWLVGHPLAPPPPGR
jgi:polyhydroxybutyrate depolymerase